MTNGNTTALHAAAAKNTPGEIIPPMMRRMFVFLIVPRDPKLPIRAGHEVVGGIREGDAGKHDRHEAWAKVRAKVFGEVGHDFGRIYSVAEWEFSEDAEIQRFHKVYSIAKEANFHIRTLMIGKDE